MSASITTDNRFTDSDLGGIECPTCGAAGQLQSSAVPSFTDLRRRQATQLGVLLQCAACSTPLLARYRVRAWRDDRVELQPLSGEPAVPPERFALGYLPAPVAERFREALACYRHGLWRAFASMCHQTAAATMTDLGESRRRRLYDLLDEVEELAELDRATFELVRAVIIDRHDPVEAACTRRVAAVLLETLKDVLTQLYIRPAKLRQALKVRQFFAGQEAADPPARPRDVSGF